MAAQFNFNEIAYSIGLLAIFFLLLLAAFAIGIVDRYKTDKIRIKFDALKDVEDQSLGVEFPAINEKNITVDWRYIYYINLRKEIEREDKITHQRLTWAISFQGFLIGVMGVLLVFPPSSSYDIILLRKFSIIGIGVWGIAVALLSLKGVIAARLSLLRTTITWTEWDKLWGLQPKYVPQAFGSGETYNEGNRYALLLPMLFVGLWTLYLIIYLILALFFWIKPCMQDNLSDVERMTYQCVPKPVETNDMKGK